MAVFLNWKNYYSRTKERITANLFSYLSPRWYPTNIIGSNLYNIFEMYAEQLSSASLESEQVFNDLAIETARGESITGRSVSKLYDNFGTSFFANKLFNQNIETFGTSSLLNSYRQELRFLSQAYLIGTTVEALQKTGQGFTGIAPLILEPVNDRIGWQLTSFSASVVAAGRNVIVVDTYYPGVGEVIYTNDILNPLGKTIYYSKSRLGYNTRLLSRAHYYSGLKVIVYGLSSSSVSFRNTIENVSKKVTRADITPQFIYSDNFAYDRYFYGDSPSGNFETKVGDYVTNNQKTSASGAILRSNVVALPSTFDDYEWFYDWATYLKNDANFNPRIRSYPASTIPDTVYFKDVKFTSNHSIMLQRSSGSNGAHYVFHDIDSAHDLSTGLNNLTLVPAYTNNISLLKPRQGLRLGVYGENGAFKYYATTGEALNLYNTDFSIETWIYGIDNFAEGTFTNFVIKRETVNNSSELLTSAGWRFILDGTDKQLKLTINDGSSEFELGGSIASLFTEEPYRPHYFAASFNNSKCFIFLDGVEIASGECNLTPPNVSTGYTYLNSEGLNIGVDELLIRKEGMLPPSALQRFNSSKPYQLGYQIDSLEKERYHQLELQVFASGSFEFEYHQFSVRGVDRSYLGYPSIGVPGRSIPLSLAFTGKPEFSLEGLNEYTLSSLTAKPSFSFDDHTLTDLTGKPDIEVPGINVLPQSFYATVGLRLSLNSARLLTDLTGKPDIEVPGTNVLPDSFYANVEITSGGSNITTEDGFTLDTESGQPLER